ncbi:PucC family protein [Ferrimicrobium sp.]|uniref:PucC family protein n=1 Tax=Ferrimicrobium sp. TaxID=2926050 RepID=UPI0026276DC9|nr:PucC family protein [Ferrimicrobium sp.]
MSKRQLDLKLLSFTSIVALLIEFIFGTANVLYVTITPHNPWGASHPIVILYLHVIIGLALLINGVMMINASLEQPAAGALGYTIVGVLGIVIAIAAGLGFVNGGGRSNLLSLIMALGFTLALFAYAFLLYHLSRSSATNSEP